LIKDLFFRDKKMVGIHKKVKQLLSVIQNYALLLSKFVLGLGETVGVLSEVGSSVADRINNVYEDYTESKSNKKRYGLMDGVRSFTRFSAVKN
jgi:prophage DNA circulation protein